MLSKGLQTWKEKKHSMKEIIKKMGKGTVTLLLLFVIAGLFFPTWTKKKEGEASISELVDVQINGTKISLMLRGDNIAYPIILFVHGGPANSEIPYVRKYQDMLEQNFLVVHYDQRASGKSFHFMEDYSNLSIKEHVDDLDAVTDYLRERFHKQKIILIGHSFGTYIATIAASEHPEKYTAYIGIGQKGDPNESEYDSLNFCIQQAQKAGNQKDYTYLKNIEMDVRNLKIITPREYVRKYGGTAIKIDDVDDLVKGLFWGTEYNFYDVITYCVGALYSQSKLIKESQEQPLPQIVKELDLPFYFIMGEQDYMTSVSAASHYFQDIACKYEHELIVYSGCAHFPQFEEEERFYEWMLEKFLVCNK